MTTTEMLLAALLFTRQLTTLSTPAGILKQTKTCTSTPKSRKLTLTCKHRYYLRLKREVVDEYY